MSVPPPWEKCHVLLDATVAAGIAKILRIFCENPFLVKFFATALRGLSEGSPRALPGGQRGTLHRDGHYRAVREIAAPVGRLTCGDRPKSVD